ncbi:amidohydrolase family protein [Paraburkholderia fynbosensis]|nr:amidohydrolase family protein [Paraburkholderia fynbosensis]
MPDSDDLLKEMDRAGVDALILVPPLGKDKVIDNDTAVQAAQERPNRFKVMGRLRPLDDGTLAKLEAWAARPETCGIRLSFTAELAGLSLLDEQLRDFWETIERLRVPIALNAPGRAAEVGELAQRHETLSVMIDHLGLAPRRHSDDLDTSLQSTLALARRPNVAVKATGLLARLPEESIRGHLKDCIRKAIDSFGPSRVFWGSDLSNLDWEYRDYVNFFREFLDGLGGNCRELVMGGAIAAWLGWVPSKDH